jgi:RNA-directed DNA polymerase
MLQNSMQDQTTQEPVQIVPDLIPLWGPNPPQVQSNVELKQVLGMSSTRNLVYIGRNKCNHYTILRIRKRDGTWRQLHNPDAPMRTVQYRMLTKLLNRLTLPEYVYAFEKNRNIPEMAALHVNKHCVISLDIKDFFHSIKQETLSTIFGRLNIGLQPARTISELCTYKAFVPQGALTSPKISNLVTSVTFGPEIKAYCVANNLTLSIYADDVTVSTDNIEIDPRSIIRDLSAIIQTYGFRINKRKTKVMYHGARQYVCGAVVNAKVNLIVKDRKKLRAIVHNVTRNGIDVEAAKTNLEPGKFLNNLRGRINWYRQLNPALGQRLFLKLKGYLLEIKAAAEKQAEVAVLYKAYMEEIDRTILEEPVELPF